MVILVTGATGNVGRHVVTELLGGGARVRAFVRQPSLPAPLDERVEFAMGDLGDVDSIRRACRGVDAVFLTSADGPTKVRHETNVIDVAGAAGVPRLVKLSTVGADPASPVAMFAWHGHIEDRLRAAGVPAVILRANHFMSNVLAFGPSIVNSGRFFLPAGEARIAMVDPRDVGAVAAAACVAQPFAPATYTVTGPAAITYHDLAAQLSTVLDRAVEFVPVDDGMARQGMIDSGMPGWLADNLIAAFRLLREGLAAEVTDTVPRLTGRKARSFADFARDVARSALTPVEA